MPTILEYSFSHASGTVIPRLCKNVERAGCGRSKDGPIGYDPAPCLVYPEGDPQAPAFPRGGKGFLILMPRLMSRHPPLPLRWLRASSDNGRQPTGGSDDQE